MRKFYAKGKQLVADPSHAPVPGQPRRYAGRKMVRLDDGRTAFPATEEGFVYDETRPELRDIDRRMLKRVRRDRDMWPGDEATAAACGVPFVPLRFDDDGEWVPAPAKPASRKAKETD